MLQPKKYKKLKEVAVTVMWVDVANKVIKFQGFEDSFRHFHGAKLWFKYNGTLHSCIYQEKIVAFKIIEGYVIVDNAEIFSTIAVNDTIYFYDTFKVSETNELPTYQDIVEQFVANPALYSIASQAITMQPILNNQTSYPKKYQSKSGLLSIFDKTKLNVQPIVLQQENIIFAQDTFETIGNFKWLANKTNAGLKYKILLKSVGAPNYVLDFDINLYSSIGQSVPKIIFTNNVCTFIASSQWQLRLTKLNCITQETYCKVELKYIGTDTLVANEFESYITLFNDDSICKDDDVRIVDANNQVFQTLNFDNSFLQSIITETTINSIQLPTPAQIAVWDAEPGNRAQAITDLINTKNQANGIAGLGSDGKLSSSVIPASLLGKLNYVSTWNAATNTPTLPDPTTNKGDYYICNVKGIYGGVEYNVKDWIVSDGVQYDIVDNSEQLNGSNLTYDIWIDAVKGIDNDLPGRGQIGMPYKTIDYVLSKIDDGTITPYVICNVTPQGGTNVLIGTGDVSMLHVGQYFNLDIGTGYLYPSHTRIESISGNTISLSGSSSTGTSSLSLKFYEKLTIHCSGAHIITRPINRIGVTFETNNGAILISSNSKLISYTDIDYLMPAETLRGNWKTFLTGTAQQIYYDFTIDIGTTKEAFDFQDEWDYLYSNVSGSDATKTAIVAYNNIDNSCKLYLKYNTSYCKNGLFFRKYGYSSTGTLTIKSHYTYGYLGCLYSDAGYDYKHLLIDGDIFESPSGIKCLNLAYTDYDSTASQIIKGKFYGDIYLVANHGEFYGEIYSTTVNIIGFTSQNEHKQYVINGNITATSIYLTYVKCYANLSGYIYLSKTTNIYGDWYGGIFDVDISTNCIIYGNTYGENNYFSITNGGTIKCLGLFICGSLNTGGIISNGHLIIDGIMNVLLNGFIISGGKITFDTNAIVNGNAVYSQTGGTIIHKGHINYNNGSYAFRKSGGKLQIEGGKFTCPAKITNPIYIYTNTKDAKDLHLIEAKTNLDGINYSLLFAWDNSGNTYAPNLKIAGYTLRENNDIE